MTMTSTNPFPLPLPESGQKALQIGVKDGFVILGLDGKPFAKFDAQQASALGAILIRHAISIAMGKGSDLVSEAISNTYEKDKPKDASLDTTPKEA